MKPSLMPCDFSKPSPSSLRIAITFVRLTSLNEVSIAIEFLDCIMRSAMRWRMRVIGTRCSGRAPPPTLMWLTTSSLVTRPPRPVPATSAGLTSLRAAWAAAPGGSSLPPVFAAGAAAAVLAGAAAAGAAAAGAAAAGAGAAATAPSSMIATICWLVTVSPSLNLISLITPSTGEGTSSTTLSVSRSSRFSSRRTLSPAFLCQVAMVASETDSGRTGTLTSMLMDEVLWLGMGLFGGVVDGRVDEGVLDQLRLFDVVRAQVAGGRRGRARAPGVAQRLALAQAEVEVMSDLVPGALVHRLFLAPHHFPGAGEALE